MNSIIRIGFLTGALVTTWLFGIFSLLKSLSLDTPQTTLRTLTGIFGLVILFVGVFYGIKKARDTSGDELSYLKAVKTGVIISLIVAVMVSSFSLLYLTVVNPGFANDMIKEAEQSLKQSGASPEETSKRLDGVRAEFSLQGQIMTSLIAQSTMGTIFSLILAIFLRSKKNNN